MLLNLAKHEAELSTKVKFHPSDCLNRWLYNLPLVRRAIFKKNTPTCPRQICMLSNIDLSKNTAFKIYHIKEWMTVLRSHNCFYRIYKLVCNCIWRRDSRLETIFIWFLILVFYRAWRDGKRLVSGLKLGMIMFSCKCLYQTWRINAASQMIFWASHKLCMLF